MHLFDYQCFNLTNVVKLSYW